MPAGFYQGKRQTSDGPSCGAEGENDLAVVNPSRGGNDFVDEKRAVVRRGKAEK